METPYQPSRWILLMRGTVDGLRDKLPDTNPFKERMRSLTVLAGFRRRRARKRRGHGPAKLDHLLTDVAGRFGVDLDASDRIPAARSDPPRTID